jgi:hypothetical protein
MITKELKGYRIKYRYIDTWGTPQSDYAELNTMLEVTDFIEGLKVVHGKRLRAVFLETYEEIEI